MDNVRGLNIESLGKPAPYPRSGLSGRQPAAPLQLSQILPIRWLSAAQLSNAMFRSIQTAFAALAGACTLTVIAALLLYALASGVRSQALVEERFAR